METITLTLASDDLDGEDLQGLTRDLLRSLEREVDGVEARLPEGTPRPGERGDPVTLGTILLGILKSSTLTAALGVLRTYFERKPNLEVAMERPDGSRLALRAEHLRPEQMGETLRMARAFMDKTDARRRTGRRAVLVANATYPDDRLEDLRCPVHDAEGLAAVLRAEHLGAFDRVEVLQDAPSHEVLPTLLRTLKEAQKDDVVLLYYSGHGKLNLANHLHLCTRDTDVDALEATSIPVHSLRRYIDVSTCGTVVLMLDCCFGGAAGDAFARGGVDDQLQNFARSRGTYLMTASTGVQVALERESDRNGVFTKHLIHGIQSGEADLDGDGRIHLDELYRYVHDRVRDENFQEPMKWNLGVRGEVVVAQTASLNERRRNTIRRTVLEMQDHLPGYVVDDVMQMFYGAGEGLSPLQRERLALLDRLASKDLTLGRFLDAWGETGAVAGSPTTTPGPTPDLLHDPAHATGPAPSAGQATASSQGPSPATPRREGEPQTPQSVTLQELPKHAPRLLLLAAVALALYTLTPGSWDDAYLDVFDRILPGVLTGAITVVLSIAAISTVRTAHRRGPLRGTPTATLTAGFLGAGLFYLPARRRRRWLHVSLMAYALLVTAFATVHILATGDAYGPVAGFIHIIAVMVLGTLDVLLTLAIAWARKTPE